MGTVDDLILFTEIIEAGSLSAASRKIGIPKSTLSRRITDLERELGLHLLLRGPRHFAVTDVGASIVARGQKIRDELKAVRSIAEVRNQRPTGPLRISCPPILMDVFVADFAVRFAKNYPDVRIVIDTSDGSFNTKIEHYDLAIQPTREALANSGLVRQKLAVIPYLLVFAPEFAASLSRKVATPADLDQCAGIGWAADGYSSRWKLLNRSGKATDLSVEISFSGSNLGVIRRAALGGLGVARLPVPMCETDVKEGRLLVPLANWSPPAVTIYALYPSRRSLTLAGKLFVAGLSQHIREMPRY